jgi:hypothetical protein
LRDRGLGGLRYRFLRNDWVEAAQTLLQKFALIQPFRRLHYLERQDVTGGVEDSELTSPFEAVAYRWAHQNLPEESFLQHGSGLKFRHAPGDGVGRA